MHQFNIFLSYYNYTSLANVTISYYYFTEFTDTCIYLWDYEQSIIVCGGKSKLWQIQQMTINLPSFQIIQNKLLIPVASNMYFVFELSMNLVHFVLMVVGTARYV